MDGVPLAWNGHGSPAIFLCFKRIEENTMFVIVARALVEKIWKRHRRKFQVTFVQDMLLAACTTERNAVDYVKNCVLDDIQEFEEFYEFLCTADGHYTRGETRGG